MIDVHAHVILEGCFGAAGAHGPELDTDADGRPRFRCGNYILRGVEYRHSPFMDVGRRVAAMEDRGIEFQILSPNPLTYFHHVDPATAESFCRRHNDLLAELVASHPDRLAGLAALPMQDPVRAAAELRRAVDLGLLGASVGTDFGVPLDGPMLDLFYATVTELDVPLFLHPAPAGVDGPPGDPRLERFDLALVVGFCAEELLAVATLLFGEVFSRHPTLDVCLSHGGGAAPYLFGRLRQAVRSRPWAAPALAGEGAFEAAFRRLWFDSLVHDRRALRLLTEVVGEDHVVAGTNFAGWDEGIPPDDPGLRERLSANARHLLRLSPAAPS